MRVHFQTCTNTLLHGASTRDIPATAPTAHHCCPPYRLLCFCRIPCRYFHVLKATLYAINFYFSPPPF